MTAWLRPTGERITLTAIGMLVDDVAYWLTDAGMLVSDLLVLRDASTTP